MARAAVAGAARDARGGSGRSARTLRRTPSGARHGARASASVSRCVESVAPPATVVAPVDVSICADASTRHPGDLRYAVRLFGRQPAILVLTIVGLSLGVGIATAAFSIMNAAVLRGEGVVDPNRAPGILRSTDRSVATAWHYNEFLHLREGATRMQVEAALNDGAVVRTDTAHADAPVTNLTFVSGGFFRATGGRTIAGRPLEAADERLAGPPPVIVSFVFWTSRLNRDPQAVGRTIWIGRTAATIVGVAERGFTVPSNSLLWMPLTAYDTVYSTRPVTGTPKVMVQVFGRLLPGAALADAEAQLSGVAATLPGGATTGELAVRVRLDPHAGLGRVSSSNAIAITLFVFAVIGLVLLLTCANVATVLISTAITREREMGVRAALGASRWRIVRQLVTESLALGTLAATIGLVVRLLGDPGDRHDDRGAGRRRPRARSQRLRVSRDRHVGQRRRRRSGTGLARSWRRSSDAIQRRRRGPEPRGTAASAVVARHDPGRGLGATHRPRDAVRARDSSARRRSTSDSMPTGSTRSRSDLVSSFNGE